MRTTVEWERLSGWAKRHGISVRGARQMITFDTLPRELEPRKIGNFWYVKRLDAHHKRETVLYARVSSHDQEDDLDRQKLRLLEYAQREQLAIDHIVTETGSGLNGRRRRLLKILARPAVAWILVEHRGRLARFGVEMVDALLRGRGGGVRVVEEREVDDDVVRDMTEVLTSLCARLYDQRSARLRARRAVEAARHDDAGHCASGADTGGPKGRAP